MRARIGARDLGADMEAKKHPVFGTHDIVCILYGDPCLSPEECKKHLSLLYGRIFWRLCTFRVSLKVL